MKKDLDLIRAILLDIEECESNGKLKMNNFFNQWKSLCPKDIKEENREEYVLYQIEQIQESGFFIQKWVAVDYSSLGNIVTSVGIFKGISPQGHVFIDSIRHKDIFEKIKATAEENGGSFALETIKELGMSYLKKKIGL